MTGRSSGRFRRWTPPSFFLMGVGVSCDPVSVADFSPRGRIAWKIGIVAACSLWLGLRARHRHHVSGQSKRHRESNCPPASTLTPSQSELDAWAERNGVVVVDAAEWERTCAELASWMSAKADANSDFDRFLLSL